MGVIKLDLSEKYVTEEGCFIISDIISGVNSALKGYDCEVKDPVRRCTVEPSVEVGLLVRKGSGERCGYLAKKPGRPWELMIEHDEIDNDELREKLKLGELYKDTLK
jgi:hypothetical protein